MKNKIHLFLVILFLPGLLVQAKKNPAPKREMRAVWIATVANIDWPSKANLSVNMQQEEMIELLDLARDFKMNTVVLQIRPATDAFYPSQLEPWSQWLTGEQGKAPDPFYDPLQFCIDECRKRALKIHVWLNPYRAVFDVNKSSITEEHPTRIHPEWFVRYGNKDYFNPGLPEVRNHVARVVADIIRRYEVDAVHFDDYFYPYRIAGTEFPDQEAFEKFPRGFLKEEKEKWRRDNVNLIIRQLHDTIKAIDPYVEFGISPFGVWRNKSKDPTGSDTKAGQTNYDDLYADILKWEKEGWIDYVTPQIYWYIGKEVADYAVIADWWSKHTYGCHLYTGHAFYRIDKQSKEKAWRSAKEIIKQVEYNRKYPNIEGSMFFSAKYMRSNPSKLKERMSREIYSYDALPPLNMRVSQVNTEAPLDAKMKIEGDKINLSWKPGQNNMYFVVYKFRKGKQANVENAENIIRITGTRSITGKINKLTDPKKYYYMVSGVSKTNQESVSVFFNEEGSDQ
jgi:uncharacterized lipoprotein YddW (UPF0748 family)